MGLERGSIELARDGNSRKPEKNRITKVKNNISVTVKVLRGFNCMVGGSNCQLGSPYLSLSDFSPLKERETRQKSGKTMGRYSRPFALYFPMGDVPNCGRSRVVVICSNLIFLQHYATMVLFCFVFIGHCSALPISSL